MKIPERGPLLPHHFQESAAKGAPSGSDAQQAAHAPVERNDAVILRTRALACRTAMAYSGNLPDVRQERIMQLRRQLQEGSYCINGQRIAVNMMDESQENNAILNHFDIDE